MVSLDPPKRLLLQSLGHPLVVVLQVGRTGSPMPCGASACRLPAQRSTLRTRGDSFAGTGPTPATRPVGMQGNATMPDGRIPCRIGQGAATNRSGGRDGSIFWLRGSLSTPTNVALRCSESPGPQHVFSADPLRSRCLGRVVNGQASFSVACSCARLGGEPASRMGNRALRPAQLAGRSLERIERLGKSVWR